MVVRNFWTVAAALSPAVLGAAGLEIKSPNKGCVYTRPWEPQANPAILIPLYTVDKSITMDGAGRCTQQMFVDVARGCTAVTAVVNPTTGPLPLDHPDIPALQACMQLLDEHNVTMIGYTFTKQATVDLATGIWSTHQMRPPAEIARDMDTWLHTAQGMQNFKGFFLDDTTNYYQTFHSVWGVDHVAHYRMLTNLAKQKLQHAKVILNPGSFIDLRLMRSSPEEGYPVAAEITIPFEDYAYRWRPDDGNCTKNLPDAESQKMGSFGPGPWCSVGGSLSLHDIGREFNVPKWDHVEPFIEAVARREFSAAAVVHSATREFAFRECQTAHKNGFRYFYATDIKLVDGPWGRVPLFWDDYLKSLDRAEANNTALTVADSNNSTTTDGESAKKSDAHSSQSSAVLALIASLLLVAAWR